MRPGMQVVWELNGPMPVEMFEETRRGGGWGSGIYFLKSSDEIDIKMQK